MHSEQITTVTIIEFDSFISKTLAFMSMGILPFIINGKGLQVHKLMGSGANNGFGAWPNFSRYAFVAIWENQKSADNFFENNKVWSKYISLSSSQKKHTLKNTMAHGTWGGSNPFEKSGEHVPENKVAVITRATIKWSEMIKFWKQVPSSSKDLHQKDGLIFAIGIGEWPMRFQATFSIWENSDYMKRFAYESKQHTDMIKMTKERGWYKEELFARFSLI